MASKERRRISFSSLPSTPPLSPPSLSSPPSSPSPPVSPTSHRVCPFISKLYDIVSDPSTQSIVCWSDHGLSFLVPNEYQFVAVIMKQHFRHSNFSSFVRQLNFYGFRKKRTGWGSTQFDNEYFRRGRKDLLYLIVRKSGGATDGGGEKGVITDEKCRKKHLDVQELEEQIRQLKSQYEELTKMQQRILFLFERYMSSTAEAGIRGSRKTSVRAEQDEMERECDRSAVKMVKPNDTGIPMELARSALIGESGSLHPLLLTESDCNKESERGSLNIPPSKVAQMPMQRYKQRQTAGVCYEGGDNPSSHSTTSAGMEVSDRISIVPVSLSDSILSPMGTPEFDDTFPRSYSALAANGVLYAPPADE